MTFDRASTFSWLRTSPATSVLVVGGGINGAGLLRELALNGIDALLVEKSDFASGATGASSRMIHGGLRYLENGEFRLVREALHERNRLLRNAPHCVHPLETVIPLFSRFTGFGNAARKFLRAGGRPSRRGSWLVKTGLSMYEAFAGRDNPLPRHRMLSISELRRTRPGIHPDAIGAAVYHDAWNPRPERLCLEVIEDALQLHAATRAANYCSLSRLVAADVVELRDEATGETFRIRPQIVVNATGAWVDFANARIENPTKLIGGTKGSHLVLDHPALLAQTGGAEIFYENDDGRICLILPVGDRIIAGTTDIRIDDPGKAVCDDDERRYILEAVREIFPGIELGPEHVVSCFCGVRPLPRSEAGRTGAISRDHSCVESAPSGARTFPVFSLVGGKWTSFRALAAQTCDTLLDRLGRERRADSRQLPIGGGREYPATAEARNAWIAEAAAVHRMPASVIESLFERHGTHAARIAAHLAARGVDGGGTLGPHFEGELDYMVRYEMVLHLDDLVLRRTDLALFGHLDLAKLRRLGELAAAALDWNAERLEDELRRTTALLVERHAVRLG